MVYIRAEIQRRRRFCASIAVALAALNGAPLAHAARNLALANGSFDVDLKYWTSTANVTSAAASSTTCSATKCLMIDDRDSSVAFAKSEAKTVAAGEQIDASMMVKVASGSNLSGLTLGIAFYNGGTLIETQTSKFTGSLGAWVPLKASAIAPAGSNNARVVIESAGATAVLAYVDNVVLWKSEIQDKGSQLTGPRISAVAIDANSVYVAANGNPAKFAHYSLQGGTALKEFTLGGAEEFWSVAVASDGSVYFATATGKFYKYSPSTGKYPTLVKDFGAAIWSLKTDSSGCVYGGRSVSDYTFKAFKHCSDDLSPRDMELKTADSNESKQRNVRSLAVANNKLYWGLGPKAKMFSTDLNGVEPVSLFDVPDKEYPYYTDVAGSLVFARLTTPGNITSVRHLAGSATGATIANVNSIGVFHAPTAYGNTVFYTKEVSNGEHNQSFLSSFLIKENKESALKIAMSASAAFSYSASELISVLREPYLGKGQIVRYPLGALAIPNNAVQPSKVEFTPPDTATEIRTLAVDGGKTYSTGYLDGGIAIDNGSGNAPLQVAARGQAEGLAMLDGRLYAGFYPGAELISYTVGAAGLSDPVPVANLGKTDAQDRMFAMLPLPAHKKMVIGTIPKANGRGTLVMYTVGSPGTLEVRRDDFFGQTVIALANIGDTVYGGTSTWSAFDERSAKTQATFFKLNATQAFTTTAPITIAELPKTAITALLAVGRQVWVMAEDTLYIYDHDTQRFTTNGLRFNPNFTYGAWKIAWNAASMVESNGYVYMSVNNTVDASLYRVNIAKPDRIELVKKGGVGMLKVDATGDLYYLSGPKVMKYDMVLP